eukprot:Platyproteum_vivax@DN9268_c0_g1_i1.p1
MNAEFNFQVLSIEGVSTSNQICVCLSDSLTQLAISNACILDELAQDLVFDTNEFSITEENLLSHLIQHPIKIDIFNCPNGQVAKNDENLLGFAELSLAPLIHDTASIRQTLPLTLTTPQDSEDSDDTPTLSIEVSVPVTLGPAEDRNDHNILTVTVNGVYNIPPDLLAVAPPYSHPLEYEIDVMDTKMLHGSLGFDAASTEKNPIVEKLLWPESTAIEYRGRSFKQSLLQTLHRGREVCLRFNPALKKAIDEPK